jgi:predicted nucleic acid-binding protein
MPWQFDPSGIVFADTSGLFALAVERDQRATAAQELQRAFIAAQTQLITTNFVVAEIHALMLTRVGASAANSLLATMDESRTLIVRADEEDELRARVIIRQYGDHGYSLTDAISFAVMDRLGRPRSRMRLFRRRPRQREFKKPGEM